MNVPAPLIGHHALLVLLVQVTVLLAAAIALGRLANRLGLPNIVGELLAGVLLGPSLFGLIAPGAQRWLFPAEAAQQNLLDAVGQIGIMLLVGLSAAQLDLGYVRRQARAVTAVSLSAFVIPLGCGVALGLAAPAQLMGEGTSPAAFALFTGTVLAVSAIPVIAKTLSEMGLLHRNVGQLTLACGTVDDALGWSLLSMTAALATVGLRVGSFLTSVAVLVGLVALTLLLRPALRGVLTRVDREGPARAVPLAVVLIIGGAAVTQSLHLEAILGAFLAGLLIGGTCARSLAPLLTVATTVFAPLFLATAGLRVDLRVLGDPAVAVAAVVLLVVAVAAKFGGALLGAKLVRLSTWEAIALGAGLNARGAVEIVIAMAGLRLGVLGPASYTVVVFVAVATSVMAPPLLRWAMSRVDQDAEERQRAELGDAWSGAPIERTAPDR